MARTKRNLQVAIAPLKEAVAKDPRFARAWEMLGAVLVTGRAWDVGDMADYQAGLDAISTALRLDPSFVPAMVNLADLDRARGMDAQGAELLRKALAIEPDNADVLHSMGLLRVRQHDYAGALALLRRAHELAADNARYAYVYAVALNSNGAHGEALTLLEQTHRQHPGDRDVLLALVSIARDAGNLDAALLHARELVDRYPADPQLRTLLQELQRQQAH